MNAPVISVVMPFYNASATLRSAIESILGQSFTDFELLLYDDGSTDTSRRIADEIAGADPRVQLLGGERVGIVGALQRLCAQARGAYLARMDADDAAHPDRLAQQLARIQRDPAIGLCGCLVVPSGDALKAGGARYYHWVNGLTDHSAIVRELFVECPIVHPTFFMDRRAFERVGGYRESDWPEDYDLIFRLWISGARFAKVSLPLLEWRNAPNRLSLTDPRYSLTRFRALKRHYLMRSLLDGIARGTDTRTFIQWGAGEVGKRWLREWELRPNAVVDIHPRKIGARIHQVPVIAPDDLPPPGAVLILVAVGAPGARDEIRAWLTPRGYRETADYWFIA